MSLYLEASSNNYVFDVSNNIIEITCGRISRVCLHHVFIYSNLHVQGVFHVDSMKSKVAKKIELNSVAYQLRHSIWMKMHIYAVYKNYGF